MWETVLLIIIFKIFVDHLTMHLEKLYVPKINMEDVAAFGPYSEMLCVQIISLNVNSGRNVVAAKSHNFAGRSKW